MDLNATERATERVLLILPWGLVQLSTITQQAAGIPILQSNYGLRLKTVILNGILYAKGPYNDVVFYMTINPVVDSLSSSVRAGEF